MSTKKLCSLAVYLTLSYACADNPVKPTETSGCTDAAALNFTSGATKSDGSCTFSRVAFYVGTVVPVGALPITVSIDGQVVGTVTGFYPTTPPGNCSADFTAQKVLADGRPHDWNARTSPYLPGGGFASNAGTVKAERGSECIRVRVF